MSHAQHHLSRRNFLQISGTSFLGAAAGLNLLNAKARAASGAGIPSPVSGFSPVLEEITGGAQIPFFLPVEVDPFTNNAPRDPSLITDFHGEIGLVEADGVGDPANNSDGLARRWAADIRFMRGHFRDRAGVTQLGTFAFF